VTKVEDASGKVRGETMAEERLAMALDELKARARRLPDELLTQGDLAIADELLAADCSCHAPAALAPGVAGMKRWVTALRRAFPDLFALVEAEIAEGDTVVQRIACSGTHLGEFLGLPPTGRRAAWELVTIQHTGPDGKVAELWSSWDHLGLLQQLDAIPARDRTATREESERSLVAG
jgi:predicted ester cyclase